MIYVVYIGLVVATLFFLLVTLYLVKKFRSCKVQRKKVVLLGLALANIIWSSWQVYSYYGGLLKAGAPIAPGLVLLFMAPFSIIMFSFVFMAVGKAVSRKPTNNI